MKRNLPYSDNKIDDLRQIVQNFNVKSNDILYTFRDGLKRDKNGREIDQFSKIVFSTCKARNAFLAVIKERGDKNLKGKTRFDSCPKRSQ